MVSGPQHDALYSISYEIDIAKSAGTRIVKLTFDGKPVGRRGAIRVGGEKLSGEWCGSFPYIPGAWQLWADSDEVRNTVIGWVMEKGNDRPGSICFS